MLENVSNAGVAKNLRYDLVWSFIRDELDVQRSEVIFQSQIRNECET